MMRLPFATTLLATLLLYGGLASAQDTLDASAIEQATGLKAQTIAAENIVKVSKPRTDVKIVVDHWTMPPFMGLTSWAAFTPAHDDRTMMMGDTVVFEDEVNPAMSAALDNGLEVTALHNHFFSDEPKVYFMHIGGVGDAVALAHGVRKVYDAIADVRAAHPAPQKAFPAQKIAASNSISPRPIEDILGKGQAQDGMFKVVVGGKTAMHGVIAAKEMGVNTWAAFAGSDEEAVVDGDFAMTETELPTVLKAMRKEGLNIVAIHQHMTREQPRIMFLHYWAKGKATDLAQSLGTVLEEQSGLPH